MTIKLFNHTYLLIEIVTIGLFLLLYYFLKNKSDKFKKIVIFIIMLLNVSQHFLKPLVWPHMHNEAFGMNETAYNMCALLIILSPIVFFIKNNTIKSLTYMMGMFSGFIAISYPYWFFNQTIFQWDYLRFYTCHLFLFLGSILPISLNIVKVSLKDFYKEGILYFVCCFIILLNNLIVCIIELPNDGALIFERLYSLNPCFIMHPREDFKWANNIIEMMSPKIFLGSDTKFYVPILWYIIPGYIFISVLSFIAYSIVDKNSFLHRKKKI